MYNSCNGRVEIKYYEVLGWDFIGFVLDVIIGVLIGNEYLGFVWVNYVKFVVSDVRVNIGISNFVWDYFYVIVGVSFGIYDFRIVF